MEEELQHEEQQQKQSVKVWIPSPESHKVLIISIIAAIGMIFIGILLIWGHIAAIVSGVLMIALAIWIHFLLQRWLQLEKAILYWDRGEFFVIFLNKKDKKLDAYLHGQLEVDTAARKPAEVLLELAELSVISHISEVHNTCEKDNGKIILYVSHDVIPYPYTGYMELRLKPKCYENYDELLQTALSKKQNRT